PGFGKFHGNRVWELEIRGSWEGAPDSADSGYKRESRILAFSGELFEEAEIVLEEAAQIVDTVAQHGETLHAEAEGEAGVTFRVDAAVPQHVRMHHAAAQHFQPAGAAIGAIPR